MHVFCIKIRPWERLILYSIEAYLLHDLEAISISIQISLSFSYAYITGCININVATIPCSPLPHFYSLPFLAS